MAKFCRKNDRWQFYCPGCNEIHEITDAWEFNGDVNTPHVSPSILVNRNGDNPTVPICHSFVTNGFIQFLPDCTHVLAGHTVPLGHILDA